MYVKTVSSIVGISDYLVAIPLRCNSKGIFKNIICKVFGV